MNVALIVPALNEQTSIGPILDEIPAGLYRQVLVVDNGSTDGTAAVARARGAFVVSEPRRGYGNACLQGIAHLDPGTDIVVFMDADGADVPPEANRLIEPIALDRADFVVGSRERGVCEPGALSPHQRWGNRLAVTLIQAAYGFQYSDLGPFRAIRCSSLRRLGMADRTYGWTIEMQIKALRSGLRALEVPVSCRRRRHGKSKVSGSLTGSVAAGFKILWTIATA